MRLPSNRIRPSVGSISLTSRRPVVVLPQPDFADEAEGLARRDRHVDAVDRPDRALAAVEDAAANGKMLGQPDRLDQRRRWGSAHAASLFTGA